MPVLLMEIPDHIRQLADDASADARSVLADWFEEQGDLSRAAVIRAGGMSAQIAILPLLRGVTRKNDSVIIKGTTVFSWCAVDVEMKLGSRPVYGGSGNMIGRTSTRGGPEALVRVVGRPMIPRHLMLEMEDRKLRVDCISRDELFVIDWASCSWVRTDGDAVLLNIEGLVVNPPLAR